MRVAIGVIVTSLAGALFVIKDAGKMETAAYPFMKKKI